MSEPDSRICDGTGWTQRTLAPAKELAANTAGVKTRAKAVSVGVWKSFMPWRMRGIHRKTDWQEDEGMLGSYIGSEPKVPSQILLSVPDGRTTARCPPLFITSASNCCFFLYTIRR